MVVLVVAVAVVVAADEAVVGILEIDSSFWTELEAVARLELVWPTPPPKRKSI